MLALGQGCGRRRRERQPEALLGRHDRADHLAHGERHRAGAPRVAPVAGRRRHAGQERVFLLPVPDPARVEDHVAVDHLAGQRVGPQARHGVGHVGGDPAEGAVVDVLGVELVAAFLLPADGDGVAEADLLERLVPLEDALLDVRPVLVRDGVLDVPDDLLLGRRELGLGVGLLQPPAVDLPDEVGVGVGRAEVLGRR